ncbi:MAG TPA: hypothetical protein VF792_08685 [Ktedonobacterales bacterium]
MDADSIVEQARSDRPPSEWNIWPLRRDFVRGSAIRWGLLAIFGFAIFIPVTLQMIPGDFVGTGTGEKIFSIVVLALLGTLAFGSAGIVGHDVWRLQHARDFMLVITPEFFLKATPGHVVLTPLEHVTHVTLNGVVTASPSGGDVPPQRFPFSSQFINFANPAGGATAPRQRARGAATLAYLDSRDNKIITVCTDDAFDSMAAICDLLRSRAATRSDKLWRESLQPRQN